MVVRCNDWYGCHFASRGEEDYESRRLSTQAGSKLQTAPKCKKSSVYVVYTRWKNLTKTSNMVLDKLAFHRPENVKRISIEKNGPIVRGTYTGEKIYERCGLERK